MWNDHHMLMRQVPQESTPMMTLSELTRAVAKLLNDAGIPAEVVEATTYDATIAVAGIEVYFARRYSSAAVHVLHSNFRRGSAGRYNVERIAGHIVRELPKLLKDKEIQESRKSIAEQVTELQAAHSVDTRISISHSMYNGVQYHVSFATPDFAEAAVVCDMLREVGYTERLPKAPEGPRQYAYCDDYGDPTGLPKKLSEFPVEFIDQLADLVVGEVATIGEWRVVRC